MKEKLEILINNFKQHLDYYKNSKNNYNETETRNEYLNPFFNLLGWDVNNTKGVKPELREVMVERQSHNRKKPDYTFTLNGVKKFFVEAKKPAVSIESDPKPAFQARSYGWSARHPITVLTNFEYLLIYDTTVKPEADDSTSKALLKKYYYTEYLDKWDEIKSYLSKEVVYSGEFEDKFDELLEDRDKSLVDEYFLNQINEWRLDLANYLHNIHPQYSIERINDLTQEFINQIVFLRICEDRNLPTYHKLEETLEKQEEVKNRLTEIFKYADNKYNSGIFNGDNIIFDLSNDTIMNIIKTLYYPESPYVFSIIEANLLGEIYEMFLAEKLILSNGQIVLQKKEENQNRDVVTTPLKVVKYMVENTLKPLCSGRNPEEIFNLNIGDISCGSGIFLLEAYDFLMKYLLNWYLEYDQESLIEGQDGELKLPFEIKKNTLISCIYGVDIDCHAVEVAKFSLLLKLLEDETEPSLYNKEMVLPELDKNIQVGNSLIDFEHIEYYERYYEKINRIDKYKISPFNWNFSNNINEFDVLVGNPPYVNTENLKKFVPKEEFKIYDKKYNSSSGQFDKYFLFIERSLKKLKSNGIMCYIVPPKFSKIVSGEKLRILITNDNHLAEFINFGSMQLFKEKSIYSSILKLSKSPQQSFSYEKADHFKDLNEWWLDKQSGEKNSQRRSFSKDVIDEEPWILLADEKEAKLYDLMYQDIDQLGDIFNVTNGIQTSANNIYIFDKEEIIETVFKSNLLIGEVEEESYKGLVAENNASYMQDKDSTKYNDTLAKKIKSYKIEKNGKVYEIEKDILKPFYKVEKGKEKGKGSYDIVEANKLLIFPYDDEGNLYSEEEMEELFSGCWEYLNDYKERLSKRSIRGGKGVWYQFGRTQNLTIFINTPKLVAGVNTKYPFYYYDTNDWFLATGGTAGNAAIIKEDDSPYELEYIQAILSHPAMKWLLDIRGSAFENNYRAKGTSILEKAPIKRIDFDNPTEVKKYNNIINWTREVYKINEELSKEGLNKNILNNLLNEKEYLIKRIRSEVANLYKVNNQLLELINNN